jgi:hypothetical protein
MRTCTNNLFLARRLLAALLLIPVALAPVRGSAATPAREQVLAAMKKASTFMTEKAALRGGYVWLLSDDLKRRWGEIPARPSQIWLQGGTELMGQVFLDAYEATNDGFYLAAARNAADALVFGQHPLGGITSSTSIRPECPSGTKSRPRNSATATRNTATTTATPRSTIA